MFILRNRLIPTLTLLLEGEGSGSGSGTGTGSSGSGDGQGGGDSHATVEKPAALADRFWNADKKEIRFEELNGELEALTTFKAESDVRMQGVPKEAAGYQISLDGIEMPEGIEFKLDDNHPLVAPAREWAKEAGIPQEHFQKLFSIYAKSRIAELQDFNTKVAEEHKKLGASATARVQAVEAALKGRIGDRAAAIMPMLVTAAAVEALEAVLRTTTARGPGNGGNNKPSADYAKMSPLERIAYAHEKAAKKAA